MATESYLIAQQVVHRVKERCPRLIVPEDTQNGQHCFTFFPNTAQARCLDLKRTLDHGGTYWAHLDRELTLRKWHDPVNEKWMAQTCRSLLLDEIYTAMGIPNRGDPQDALVHEDDETVGIIEKALRVAKLHLWGIPVNLLTEMPFFHFMLTGYAKKAVQEPAWKLACRNAGNIYNVNDTVLADAVHEREAYQSLYAIHPLLGRAWVPWIRTFVENTLQSDAQSAHYAQQFKAAMQAQGVSRAGMRTLHRLAELSPNTFRRVMYYLIRHKGEDRVALVGMLHFLNGKKPPSGATFGQLVGKVLDPYASPDRLPNELDLVLKISRWLDADPRFDRDLVYDWLHFMVNQRPGALSRGYQNILRQLPVANKRKEAVLEWANRAQEQWHRHLPRVGWICTETEAPFNFCWEPLLSSLGIQRNAQGQFAYTLPPGDWLFVELVCTKDLWEEGEIMDHCVDQYDEDCRSGRSRLFSVRNHQGARVSTLELRPGRGSFVRVNGEKKPKFSHYWIAQHRGFRNTKVSEPCQKAAEQFLTVINAKH
ncbi:hypothetical protein DLNHIDIE_00127 [Acidithiobacillus thiooxidans ATCC 19377]|uniref:Uncharacterized protein n=3 Tax=Acidithiobacillus thiooxidans TaxID=930 RepID=A0A543Q1R6_ACITH|nr:hypothetical protein GCD22_01686 [Acidithiobacillus thiooxidans ATCC 19377]TQN50274.1 hypothetical protein DLNHIDIE_00127 [Acidithiobacillus thiooxidans ATCC 19377]